MNNIKISVSVWCVEVFVAGSVLLLSSIPTTYAQGGAVDEVNRLIEIFEGVATIVQGFIIIAVGCAFLWFFWGLAEYIRKEGGLEEAKKKIFWGLLAIFILTSVWGIVYFFGLIFLGDSPGARGTTAIQTFRLPVGGDPGDTPPPERPTPQKGRCNNSVRDGCAVGNVIPQTRGETTTHHTWYCRGTNGGSSSGRCSKQKPPVDGTIPDPGDGPIETLCTGGNECPPGSGCGYAGDTDRKICQPCATILSQINAGRSIDSESNRRCDRDSDTPDPGSDTPDPDSTASVQNFFQGAPTGSQIFIVPKANPVFQRVDPDFVTDDTDVSVFHSFYTRNTGGGYEYVCHNGQRTQVEYPDPETFFSEDRDRYTAFFRQCFTN